MSSSNELPSSSSRSPRRLATEYSPPMINILVEERDMEDPVKSPVFQAPCLFRQASLNDAHQGSSTQPEDQKDFNSASSGDEKPSIESRSIAHEGLPSQLAQHQMEPIMEAGHHVETRAELDYESSQLGSNFRPQVGSPVDALISLVVPPARKSIKTTLNLEKVISQQMVTVTDPSARTGRGDKKSDELPGMSTRRKQMTMPTNHELQIEQKVFDMRASSVMQPVFQAIWKVILTMCFDQKALKAHMLKANLITVPIRALHYNEILCLFRKAHGPLLQIQKVDDSAKSRSKKKASLITADETVQGFASYQNFCKDLTQMLGDGILLLTPDMYTIVVQLIFEAVSFQSKNRKGENVIMLRRITDISSPFLTPITDDLPVQRIFTLAVMDQVVKLFCMKEYTTKELTRLTERRFIPSALQIKDFKATLGDQFFDQIDKVIQHSAWKENRSENASRLQNSRSPELGYPRSQNSSAMKKISHRSKHQKTVALPANSTQMKESESAGRCPSEVTSDDGKNNDPYSTLSPKLRHQKDQESPLTVQQRITAKGRISPGVPDSIKAMPGSHGNAQFHIQVSAQMPRTPQASQNRRRDAPQRASQVSQMAVTDKNTDMVSNREREEHHSVTVGATQRQGGETTQSNKREILSREAGGYSSHDGYSSRRQDRKHKLMDMMHKNHKYRKLAAKTKLLHQTNDIQELQQFAVHRQKFDKLRQHAAEVKLSGSLGGSSLNDTFNIQINSKGKLEEIPDDIQPIDEKKELKDDVETKPSSRGGNIETLQNTKRTQSTEKKQQLYDFKPLLLTSGILRTNDSFNNGEFDEEFSPIAKQDFLDATFQQEEQIAAQTKDYLHWNKTFNRSNLQQCRQKNKRLIANNLRAQNEIKQQKGYNACLLTGQRLDQQPKTHTRQQKSQNVTKVKIPKLNTQNNTNMVPTDPQTPDSTMPRQNYDSSYFNGTFAGSQEPLQDTPALGVTDPTRLDSFMTSMQIGPNGYAIFKPVMAGGAWIRRGSNPKTRSQMGQSAHSQRPKLRSIGSPDSDRSRRGNKQGARQPDDQDFGNIIFCRTIPTMVREFQSRMTEKGVGTMDDVTTSEQSHAIPIRLHLAQASMAMRAEFLPVSVHVNGAMRDSLTAPSRVSRSPEPEPIQSNTHRSGEDDGICTVRAESHLEGNKALENALKQASITENGSGQKGAKIVLVAPKSQIQQFPQLQAALRTRNTNPTSIAQEHAAAQAKFVPQRQASDIQVTMNNASNQASSHVSGDVSAGASGHISGQVDLKLDSMAGKDETLKEKTDAHLKEYQASLGRTRVISTADNQFRKNKKKVMGKDQKSHQYKSELQGESLDEIIEDSKLNDNIFVEARQVTGDTSRIEGSRLNRNKMNFGDIGRWQASLESPGLIMNPSDATGIQSAICPAPPTVKSEAVSNANYHRQKPRDAQDIDLSSSSQPQKTMHSAVIDLSRRTSRPSARNHEKNYQKGEFIAPRRAMTRKQRLNIKTPINLLAIHDYKGVKNLNLTIVNPDLVTSRVETDTMNLSQSIRTPDGRRRMRHGSVHDHRQHNRNTFAKAVKDTPNTLPLRTPTPIKIVDLSARPAPLVERQLSLKQEYMQHFPLLNNRAQPLKQEMLRKATGVSANNKLPQDKVMFRRPHHDPTSSMRTQMTLQSHSTGKTSLNTPIQPIGVDLKSMVGFLVRSPVMSPHPPNHSPPRVPRLNELLPQSTRVHKS